MLAHETNKSSSSTANETESIPNQLANFTSIFKAKPNHPLHSEKRSFHSLCQTFLPAELVASQKQLPLLHVLLVRIHIHIQHVIVIMALMIIQYQSHFMMTDLSFLFFSFLVYTWKSKWVALVLVLVCLCELCAAARAVAFCCWLLY